jgi:hypothetical protein
VHGGLGREDGPAASHCSMRRRRLFRRRLPPAPPDKKAAKSPSCGVVIMDCGNQPA